ncbi:MAG: type transport system permease protein [Acidobacteriota bacterium]|jgi:ABC-type transport system involved in multi-copper enzyme maturation permease subunit|nr:type transport system permease protein [Acidobacteriota bacterium]
MLAIYWREVRDLLKSLRFIIALAIFLLGMAINGFVTGRAYQDLLQMHEQIESQNGERLGREAAHLEKLAIDFNEFLGSSGEEGQALVLSAPPPKVLPLVAGAELGGLLGVQWNFPNILEPGDLGIGNLELPARPALDWEFLIRILLSFIAVILSYDLIVGERERGTLALTLAYPVSRRRVLCAKFLAVLTLLGWLLAAGAILSTLVYLMRGGGTLAASDYARIVLFCLGALVYLGIFVAVSLLVSSRARSSVSSLTILLIFWITATVVIPQGAAAAVQGSVATLSDIQVEQKVLHQLDEQINEMVGEMDAFVRSDIAEARKDGFSSERKFAQRVNQMLATITVTLDEQQVSHRAQARAVQNVIRLTPSGLFQLGSERLLGVGDTREQHFLKAIDRWSEAYTGFIREQEMLDPDSPHIFYVQNYMSQRAVDAAAVPRFSFKELSLAESLKNAALDWMLLALELAVALILSFAAFARAPVSETVGGLPLWRRPLR